MHLGICRRHFLLRNPTAENFPARPENALNTSVRGIHSNGTNVSDEVGEWELTEVDFPHIFDLFTVRLILFTLYSLVFIVCVVGNLAVVLVMAAHRRMRNGTTFFLGQLAMANLCVGLFCIYQHLILYLAEKWILGKFLCKVHHFVISLSQTASVLILVVTTVERYCVITRPVRGRHLLTMRRRGIIILIVWVLSATLSFHKFYYVTTMEHQLLGSDGGDSGKMEILCSMDVTNFDHKTADNVTFLLLFFLPLVAIVFLCTKAAVYLRNGGRQWVEISRDNTSVYVPISDISSELLQQQRSSSLKHRRRYTIGIKGTNNRQTGQLSAQSSSGHMSGDIQELRASSGSSLKSPPSALSVRHCHKNVRVIKTLMAVAFCFTLFNSPFYVQKILQNYFDFFEGDNEWLELIPPLTFLLMCLNCAINPFLHALLTRRFQECLLELVKYPRNRP